MDTEYKNYLADKNVVIVGGHDSSISGHCQDVIAWADVVIRINDHWRRQRGRCEVLYYSCDNSLDLEMFDEPSFKDEIQWVWLNKMHTLFDAGAGNFYNVTRKLTRNASTGFFYQAPAPAFTVFEKLRELSPEHNWLRDLAEAIGDCPLTGMTAVEHARLSKARSVYVTGMNFYTDDVQKFVDSKTHDMKLQLQWLAETVRWDKRFSLSPELVLVLNEYSG